VMGLSQKILTRVRSGEFLVAQVGLAIYGFLIKVSNFSIISLRIKKNIFRWAKKYPGQRWVGLLFTAGLKYA